MIRRQAPRFRLLLAGPHYFLANPFIGALAFTVHAVKFLHQNDIVHRDIKPENVLLDSDGRHSDPLSWKVKLCDFGGACFGGTRSPPSKMFLPDELNLVVFLLSFFQGRTLRRSRGRRVVYGRHLVCDGHRKSAVDERRKGDIGSSRRG
eukprot:Selendium_serpulae@DN8209_c0_g1_i1.p1